MKLVECASAHRHRSKHRVCLSWTDFTRIAGPNPNSSDDKSLRCSKDSSIAEFHQRFKKAFGSVNSVSKAVACLVEGYFPAVQPQSIISSAPVIICEASLARYNAAAATSDGLSIRPNSCVSFISRSASCGSADALIREVIKGVSTL